jgi:membrane-associated protease RseP (regulator of RpoE activity)
MNDSVKVDAKMLVDSGASHGIFLESTSDSMIQIPAKNIDAVLGRGLGGVIFGKIARIKSMDISDYRLEEVIANFPLDYSPKDTTKTNARTTFRNGSIGGDLLSRFTVVFNFPDEKIYLKKNAAFKKKFYYSLSGLTLRAKGNRLNEFEITDVRKNTPAERSGIQIGDQLLFINGFDLSELELNNVNSLLSQKPGKKIKVQVLRNGEKLKKEFTLESVI